MIQRHLDKYSGVSSFGGLKAILRELMIKMEKWGVPDSGRLGWGSGIDIFDKHPRRFDSRWFSKRGGRYMASTEA